MSKVPLIALLTDFGLVDPYTGILKAVISQISPGIQIVDLTHEIPPGDILRAAVYLWQSRSYFPDETIFVCIVDPGVGSSRRGIIIQSHNQTFIGPDNGLFTFVMTQDAQAWEITNFDYMLDEPSATFHGRDVFAPVAAYAALGVKANVIGSEITKLMSLDNPKLEVSEEGSLLGEILFADRFGNIFTSIGRLIQHKINQFTLEPWIQIHLSQVETPYIFSSDFFLYLSSGTKLRWVRTFSDLEQGECGFLVGSSGLIEIVAKGASADRLIGPNAGEQVILRKSGI
jgi:hypothetical protein